MAAACTAPVSYTHLDVYKRQPIVHVAAIPGCETCNARYFSSHGMSRACRTTKDGLRSIFEILDHEEIRAEMIRKQQEQVHQDSAAQICGLAERLSLRRRGSVPGMETERTGGMAAALER